MATPDRDTMSASKPRPQARSPPPPQRRVLQRRALARRFPQYRTGKTPQDTLSNPLCTTTESFIMKTRPVLLGLMLAVLVAAPTAQAERIDHHKGLPANTLEEAVTNFSKYNHKLAAILEQDSLSPEDMDQIHRLTYTLENALEKLHTELGELAETLEELHVASETGQFDKALQSGRDYLETARKVID